jgi:hypothetical protein
VTLAEDTGPGNLAARNNIPILPVVESFRQCASADLVIANTAVAAGWVNAYLQEYAMGARSLVWWIHEIDACSYADQMNSLGLVAMALFDSHASLRNWADAGSVFPPLTRVIHPGVDDAFVEMSAKYRTPVMGFCKDSGSKPEFIPERKSGKNSALLRTTSQLLLSVTF